MSAPVAAMTFRVTDRDDPALTALLAAVGLPEPFDYAHTTRVVIAEEAGVPIGFASGCRLGGHPVLEHFALRPEVRGQHRTRAMVDAYLQTWVAEGEDHVLMRVDREAPHSPRVRAMLAIWPATLYATTDARYDWYVKRAERAA